MSNFRLSWNHIWGSGAWSTTIRKTVNEKVTQSHCDCDIENWPVGKKNRNWPSWFLVLISFCASSPVTVFNHSFRIKTKPSKYTMIRKTCTILINQCSVLVHVWNTLWENHVSHILFHTYLYLYLSHNSLYICHTVSVIFATQSLSYLSHNLCYICHTISVIFDKQSLSYLSNNLCNICHTISAIFVTQSLSYLSHRLAILGSCRGLSRSSVLVQGCHCWYDCQSRPQIYLRCLQKSICVFVSIYL